ncbi:MAG: GNAT family acetyltransferase [Synergistaceae bacterium]|nr:GNAT family acetyltransferase [Synergistaceae bacterium]MBR0076105.1 GNAT family acetyltransferase [Synergistaceae bacterium]MBR0253982.1 GNAT family acetyltransferase [Synergistaceae bacterium]
MLEHFFVINLREYLDNEDSTNKLYKLLSSFSCPLNPDVEHFLKHNALEFTRKDQSVTYLVFRQNNQKDAYFVGYFSLTIKPVSIHVSTISKSMARKLERISVLDENAGTYTVSAYLIAQLGKNFALSKEKRISGDELLELALDIIYQAKYLLGGVIEFLECEDNEALMNFYERNGFRFFNSRVTQGESPHKLNQLLKFIR